MGRKKVSRDLAPLPQRVSLGAAEHKGDRLLKILRALAIKNQRAQARAFYSVRDVATHFKVPLSMVAKIYHDMEHEGLLSSVRSSRTILQGRDNDRRLSVRAVVGLPALLSTFLTIPDYRMFFLHIQRELRSRGFAGIIVFFETEEALDDRLSDRFKAYQVDTVLWFQAGRYALKSLLRLSDLGVRVVAISQIGAPAIPSRYYVWREKAVEKLLREWRDRYSARKITVVESRNHRSAVTEELLRLMLPALEFVAVTRTLENQNTDSFLHDLCRLKTDGIVFPSSVLASMLAFRNPAGMTELIQTQRVAFLDGPINMPFAKLPDALVDIVTFDWPEVSQLIVNDLVSQQAFDRRQRTVIQARTQVRVSMRSLGGVVGESTF
jgi:hypothetical protein